MRKLLILALIAGSLTELNALGRRPKDLHGIIVDGDILLDLESGRVEWVRPKEAEGFFVRKGVLSPDGKKAGFIVVFKGEGRDDYWSEFHVAARDRSFDKVVMKSDYEWYYFDWSPDSKYFILASAEDEMKNKYLIISADLAQYWTVKVPQGKIAESGEIHWSENGKEVMFLGHNQIHQGAYYRMALDGKNLEHIVDTEDLTETEMSRDQKKALLCPIDDRDIYMLDIDRGDRRKIWETRKREESIYWSPDEKWVGYQVEDKSVNAGYQYYVKNIETGKKVNLNIPYQTGGLSWWQEQTETPPDCGKFVREMLGPGRPLEELSRELIMKERPAASSRR